MAVIARNNRGTVHIGITVQMRPNDTCSLAMRAVGNITLATRLILVVLMTV